MDISVSRPDGSRVADRPTEFVERKGLGHPDTLCDGVAEAVSRALSRTYRDEVGRILHHNVDKVQLVAGQSDPVFGGGEVLEPVTVIVAGRATATLDDRQFPVREVAMDAARGVVADVVPGLDAHLDVEVRTGEGSADLQSVFGREGVARANDTSLGVGYAPLTETERIVRGLEPHLRQAVPEIGPDVKVMGVRREGTLRLTVAAAVRAGRVGDPAAYAEVVSEVAAVAESFAADRTARDVVVDVNAADDPPESCYITVTGTSAEMGDDGAVGRGNRANGLITPHRPMSLEAVAGKNPVSHVGKLYNLHARALARGLHEDLGADHAAVHLVSEIGRPIDDPQAVDVATTHDDREAVREYVAEHVPDVTDLTDRLVGGEVAVY